MERSVVESLVIPNTTKIVLLVLDGLGWEQLQDRLAIAPNLASMAGGPINCGQSGFRTTSRLTPPAPRWWSGGTRASSAA